MSVVWKSRFQKHYSQRILQNEVRETPSIPVRRVRKDVLFDERHTLLPSPTSKSYFRSHALSGLPLFPDPEISLGVGSSARQYQQTVRERTGAKPHTVQHARYRSSLSVEPHSRGHRIMDSPMDACERR